MMGGVCSAADGSPSGVSVKSNVASLEAAWKSYWLFLFSLLTWNATLFTQFFEMIYTLQRSVQGYYEKELRQTLTIKTRHLEGMTDRSLPEVTSHLWFYDGWSTQLWKWSLWSGPPLNPVEATIPLLPTFPFWSGDAFKRAPVCLH